MKKLLIASDTFFPRWDGVVRFMNEVLPRLSSRYDITVVAPNYGQISRDFPFRIVRFDIMKKQLGDYYPSKVNIKVLREKVIESDIVFIQAFGIIGVACAILAKRYRKPLVFYTHLIEWEIFPKSIGKSVFKNIIHSATLTASKYLYNMCDVIIAPSTEMVDILTWRNITARKRIVHLGVDTAVFSPPKSKANAKISLKISPEKFVVGYVGRLAYEKDLRTLYRGFARLNSKHSNTLLLLVGPGRDDIRKMFMHKRNIILTGPQNEVAQYYQAMDVHVLTSLTETTSLNTLEAMSCGLPVIATPVGYINEYIQDKHNGLIIPKKDPFALYKKLEMLMNSEKFREELGRNARETVVSKFSWDDTADQIDRILQDVKSP